jgi:hypothetical protein
MFMGGELKSTKTVGDEAEVSVMEYLVHFESRSHPEPAIKGGDKLQVFVMYLPF